jgi:DNA-directed RNA polymerase alpha subunit
MPTPKGPTKIVMNKNISSPPSMEIKKAEQSSLTKEFTFEHLDLGLTVALGNTFRRLLLTRVPG